MTFGKLQRPMPLRVDRTTLESKIEVLTLSGSLTLGRDAQEFEKAVEQLASDGQNRIVVDLREVSFVDSAGIGILVGCHGKVTASGGKFRVAGAGSRVMNVLRITKVDSLLRVDASSEESIRAISGT